MLHAQVPKRSPSILGQGYDVIALISAPGRKLRLAMDETLYNGILAALEAVHGGKTANEVR